MNKLLNERFDLPLEGDILTTRGELVLPEARNDEEAVQYDYHKTRNNLYNLLEQGQDALYSALDIAKQSESPRSFEVVSNMIKQLADINLQLLDLSEKKQKLLQKKEEVVSNITNNAIFVGSTNELFKALKHDDEV